jgi:hypothetical protein
LVNSVRPWSYHLLALFPQSVMNIWMETDRVGDAAGKGGNLKKNGPSRDPRRLNSDKRTERQDQLHIGIQKENTSMKDVTHDGSARLNRLGPTRVPSGCPFSSFPLFLLPLIPLFFIFICPSFHSLCKYTKRTDS